MSMTAAPTDSQPLIVQVLLRTGTLDPKNLTALRESPPRDGEIPERALVRLGLATDREIAEAYAELPGGPPLRPPLRGRDVRSRARPAAPREALPRPAHRPRRAPRRLGRGRLRHSQRAARPRRDPAPDRPAPSRPMIAPISVVEGLIESLFSSERAGKTILSGGSKFEQSEDEEDEDARGRRRARSSTSTSLRRRAGTAGSSAWSTRSSSRPSAPGRATSTSSRSRTPARSACGSTASSTSWRRRRRPSSS